MVNRIEIGFRKNIRDALGEKVKRRIVENLRDPCGAGEHHRRIHHRGRSHEDGSPESGHGPPVGPRDPEARHQQRPCRGVRLAHRGGVPARGDGQRGQDGHRGHRASRREAKAPQGLHVAPVRDPRKDRPQRGGADRLGRARQRSHRALRDRRRKGLGPEEGNEALRPEGDGCGRPASRRDRSQRARFDAHGDQQPGDPCPFARGDEGHPGLHERPVGHRGPEKNRPRGVDHRRGAGSARPDLVGALQAQDLQQPHPLRGGGRQDARDRLALFHLHQGLHEGDPRSGSAPTTGASRSSSTTPA